MPGTRHDRFEDHERAELSKTESRQADGRKMNTVVLIISIGLGLMAASVAVFSFWSLT